MILLFKTNLSFSREKEPATGSTWLPEADLGSAIGNLSPHGSIIADHHSAPGWALTACSLSLQDASKMPLSLHKREQGHPLMGRKQCWPVLPQQKLWGVHCRVPLSVQGEDYCLLSRKSVSVSRSVMSHSFATLWTIACQSPLSMGSSRQRVLKWIAMPSSRKSSRPKDRAHISYVSSIGRGVLYH